MKIENFNMEEIDNINKIETYLKHLFDILYIPAKDIVKANKISNTFTDKQIKLLKSNIENLSVYSQNIVDNCEEIKKIVDNISKI